MPECRKEILTNLLELSSQIRNVYKVKDANKIATFREVFLASDDSVQVVYVWMESDKELTFGLHSHIGIEVFVIITGWMTLLGKKYVAGEVCAVKSYQEHSPTVSADYEGIILLAPPEDVFRNDIKVRGELKCQNIEKDY